MAGHYTLTGDFQLISEEQGTLYNVGISDIELSSDATKGQGVILRTGETQAFKGTIYARSYDESGSLNVQNFIELPGGGDGGGGGGGTPYTLPTMSQNVKGGAMVGAGLHTESSALNLNMMGESVFGGAMVGAGLHTDGWSIVLNTMGASVKGGAMLGAGLHTDAGAVHLNEMGESVFGGAKLGAGLHTDDGALTLNVMGASVLGGATLGAGLHTESGALTLNTMNDTLLGGAKLGKSMSIVTDRIEAIRHRKPSQAYALGDIAFVTVSGVKTQQLVCVKAGTTGNGDFALPSGYGEGSIHNDGTVVWAVDSYAVPAQFSVTGPAIRYNKLRNTSFRHGDITNYYKSGLMSENIRNGCYLNIYIGDTIFETTNIPEISYESDGQTVVAFAGLTITDANYRVIGLRSFHDVRVVGDIKEHIVLNLMKPGITIFRFNATNTTTGAMAGSELYQHTLPALGNVFKSIFGANHILKHKRFLTNAMNDSIPSACYSGVNGAETGWINTEVEVGVPTLSMLGLPYASSLFGNADYFSEVNIVPAEYIAWTGISIAGTSKLITVDNSNGVHYHTTPSSPVSTGPYFLYA